MLYYPVIQDIKFPDNQRKEEAQKRLELYHDLHELHTLNQLKDFSEPELLQLASLNITKKVINQLAQTYQEPPRRVVGGTDSDREIFSQIVESSMLDIKLKQASRYTKLLKTVLIRPVWRKNKMDLDILTPDYTDVEWGDTPSELLKVIVTNWGSLGRPDEVTFSIWTADKYELKDYRGTVLESIPNPYGQVPFIPCWDYAPANDFWLPGGDDLISCQNAINAKLVDLLHVLRHQAFGVGWIRGVAGSGHLKVDPGSLVELPEEGALGFESQEAKIAETIQAIDQLLKWTAITNGLPAASLSTDPVEESGISKQVSNSELEELRRDDCELWRTYEKQLFDLFRIVNNAHNSKKLSDKATLSIDFFDNKPVISPTEQATAWETLLTLGVISQVDIVMERNPDIATREDALAYLVELQQERKVIVNEG